tara:strand:- start:297 stop:1262 length:966 start_codon:yes stop_codon:yes gene_type:complete
MKKLMIVGGTGFFGKSFIDYFIRKKLNRWSISKLIIISRNTKKFKKDYKNLIGNNVRFITKDIKNTKSLPYADFIIHAAASTNEKKYLKNIKKEINNNKKSLINFCSLISNKKFNRSNIVYLSSGAVYGDFNKTKHTKEDIKISKERLLKLQSPKKEYAFSKLISEELFRKTCIKRQLNSSIARCFAFIGVYSPRDQHFVIGNFMNSLLNNSSLIIKSNSAKNIFRSFMYADDAIYLLMQMLKKSNQQCNVYNVGSDEKKSIMNIANYLSKKYRLKIIKPKQTNIIRNFYIPDLRKTKKNFSFPKIKSINQSIIDIKKIIH